MDKLFEIRSQEMLCRERALFDTERRAFWLAKAEEWEQLALDEIAFHFRECDAQVTASSETPPTRIPNTDAVDLSRQSPE
jgi:hypothetical protein